jgi:hypothetical protein
MTLDEFKETLLDLIMDAERDGLDLIDIYDALHDEAEAYGQSFTMKAVQK